MSSQEDFWRGSFGDDYTRRVNGIKMVESNIAFFNDALVRAKGIETILEIGCNRGLNLAALEYIDPSAVKTGIDINESAIRAMSMMFDDLKLDKPYMHVSSVVDYETPNRYDLVFTKGVLIHVDPTQLDTVYAKMVELSKRYILVAEYYNPTPVEVPYRGHNGKLFKRDFAGELIDRYGLALVDYGFVYHRDANWQDDITWFLLEKGAE